MAFIAVCGNHQVPYCTESELSWTLERMGHHVLRMQENTMTTEQMFSSAVVMHTDLFLYIHTHGWKTPGQMGMERLIECLRDAGIKTASFHLDRYWGLNGGDKREDRVGQHPFWKTDFVFTADGGNQERFAERGVNHRWLPPAVCKRHCQRGKFDQKYACDVAFVGAKNYHHEYPFRAQLIAWLEKTYGSRFRRYGGGTPFGVVREEPLKDLYASAKVVVGDSCFGGAPYYWSDRVPETLGRGGFLIHPQTPGLDIPGMVLFHPGDLEDLRLKIDSYLNMPEERHTLTEAAMADVAANHTYHNRMQTVLDTLEIA